MNISLTMRPERRFIRTSGGSQHIDFFIHVDHVPSKANSDRMPLALALVLDRSGSMQGEKIATAKRAVLAVLERLEERDSAAIVVFDDHIDIVQALAPVSEKYKARARAALTDIQARANTALHEGWLIGCKAIASEGTPAQPTKVSRCFLLTDGLANVGITDPEQIASEAAGIRDHAGISTSTFGVGIDYNEALLGPMAVAGGGQFHHLRTAQEITTTFVGELGALLTVAATQARIEIETEPGTSLDLVSSYWAQPSGGSVSRQSIAVGDLQSDEERHVIVRFTFPAQNKQDGRRVRTRLVWTAEGKEQSTDWQEVYFSYADSHICDSEPRDPSVMHWVGLHFADQAHREALVMNQQGNLQGAHNKLMGTVAALQEYAGNDQELQAEIQATQAAVAPMSQAPVAPSVAKESYFQKQNRSRGQKDRRGPDSSK